MTEVEWTTSSDPELLMIFLLQQEISYRKVRLYACACCRRQWEKLPDHPCKVDVGFAERYADRQESGRELAKRTVASEQFRQDNYDRNTSRHMAIAAATWTVKRLKTNTDAFDMSVQAGRWCCKIANEGKEEEATAQRQLVHDVFGNPFRPITLATAHRTPTVVSLAQAAYDERHLPRGELDPHCLVVLADALEDVGAPGELVAHLRSAGPHVRGCWPVDLCLGLT